jgi:hypothetical protein
MKRSNVTSSNYSVAGTIGATAGTKVTGYWGKIFSQILGSDPVYQITDIIHQIIKMQMQTYRNCSAIYHTYQSLQHSGY